MRRFCRWLLQRSFDGLVEFGRLWCPAPPQEHVPAPGAEQDGRRRRLLDAPPVGHPERMCREAPLTRTELLLMAELDGIGADGE